MSCNLFWPPQTKRYSARYFRQTVEKIIRAVAMNRAYVYTINSRGVAQSGSAPRLGRGGRRFKSGRPDHFRKKVFPLYPPAFCRLLFKVLNAPSKSMI